MYVGKQINGVNKIIGRTLKDFSSTSVAFIYINTPHANYDPVLSIH